MNQKVSLKTAVILILLISLFSFSALAQERIKIVSTLSSFADIAKRVGGDFVDVSSIASPRFNPHFIEAKPSDVLKLKRAELYIHSGLDLEAWSSALVDAAARPEIRQGGDRQLDLSKNINILEVPSGQISRSEGDIHILGNPHYWLDPRNGIIIAQSIANKLSELDPQNTIVYKANLDSFNNELNNKITDWKTVLAPYKDQKLVGYHNEWIYLMRFSNLTMEEFLEPKPGIPPSPGQITKIIDYVKNNNVKAIVQPTFYSEEAANEVASRTPAKVVLICQNVGEISDASNYIQMLDYNINQVVGALKS